MNDFVFNRQKKGAFEVIKYAAAFQVFFGHAVTHFNIQNCSRFIKDIISLFYGVPIFFCISGFLIMMSIENSVDIKDYIKKE